MKKVCVLTGMLLLVFAANLNTAQGKDSADDAFIKTALMGNLYEIEAGKLAAEKATAPEVKSFGQKMADEHQKAQDELKPLAEAKKISVPAALDKKHKAKVDKLGKKAGAEFDKEYMGMMVSDHKTDVAAYKKEAEKGKDAQVKSYASKALAVFEQHLTTAQSIDDGMKKKK